MTASTAEMAGMELVRLEHHRSCRGPRLGREALEELLVQETKHS